MSLLTLLDVCSGLQVGFLQPAGGRATAGERQERRLLVGTTVEYIRAARMESATGGRVRRTGNLARKSLRKQAAAVGARDCADQRLGIRMRRLRPQRQRRPDLDHPAEVHDGDLVRDVP